MKVACWIVVPVLAALTACGTRQPQPAAQGTETGQARQAAAPPAAAAQDGASPESAESRRILPAPVPIPVELARGTALRVRLARSLDTARNRAGDRFEATLASPVSRQGRVVLPKDTVFRGHLTTSRPSGRLRHRGYLGLTLDSFVLHGETYRISTSGRTLATGSHKKRNAGIIGGVAGVGALIGGLAGGGKGALIGAGSGAAAGTAGAALTGKKNVHIPAETVLTFTLRSPVNVLAESSSSAAPQGGDL